MDHRNQGEADVDVRVESVAKSYGDVVAVREVDLEIVQGEFFTMLGPSGSGKTTTLRMIAGFEEPDSGRILLAGEDVTGIPPYDRSVNTVFQDYALFPHMTVADNVEYGMRVAGQPKAERRRLAQQSLEMVRLSDYGSRRPDELSGGQKQRVALARAMVNRPRVLLLDEPLGALDLKLREQMQLELKRIQSEVGITFIYVTHDQDEALSMSDRIAVFNEGRIEQVGTPGEVYESPDTEFVADFVGTSNLIERDGRLMTIRPERIRLLAADDATEGLEVARGQIDDASYGGMVTRFRVALEDGESLQMVRQNVGGPDEDPQALLGRQVKIGWDPASAVPVQRKEKE